MEEMLEMMRIATAHNKNAKLSVYGTEKESFELDVAIFSDNSCTRHFEGNHVNLSVRFYLGIFHLRVKVEWMGEDKPADRLDNFWDGCVFGRVYPYDPMTCNTFDFDVVKAFSWAMDRSEEILLTSGTLCINN